MAVDQIELRNILSGPHKYVNGQYVSTLPTQAEIDAAENAKVAAKKEPNALELGAAVRKAGLAGK